MNIQLQRPLPLPATLEPMAVVRKPATDEMLMTRPGSKDVASLARSSVRLTDTSQNTLGRAF